jgi:hypothetical protein
MMTMTVPRSASRLVKRLPVGEVDRERDSIAVAPLSEVGQAEVDDEQTQQQYRTQSEESGDIHPQPRAAPSLIDGAVTDCGIKARLSSPNR